MRHRTLLSAMALSALAFGTFGFGPPEHAGPPDGMPDEASNGCNGIERAQEAIEGQEHPGGDHPAADVLDAVEGLLTNDEGCEGEED